MSILDILEYSNIYVNGTNNIHRRHLMANVGTLDRIVRAIVGLALIAAPFLAGWPPLVMVISVIVGVVLVATAAISFCPIYAVLGLSSKRRGLSKT
jgi:hypothetical protein